MTTSQRRSWSAQQKLAILEEAHKTGMTVSEVCRRHGVSVGQFYAWEKQARQSVSNGLTA